MDFFLISLAKVGGKTDTVSAQRKMGVFFPKVKRETFLKAALQIRKRIFVILQQSLGGNVSEFDVARVR